MASLHRLQEHPDGPGVDAFWAENEYWKRPNLVYRGQFGGYVFLLTGNRTEPAAWSVDDAG